MSESSPTEFGPFERLLLIGHRETVLFPELLAMPPEFIHSAGFVESDKTISPDTVQRRGDFDLATIWYTVSGRGTLRHQGREFLLNRAMR